MKGFPRRKVLLLLPCLLLSLMGASCAHVNPTDHSSSEPQVFDVYVSGTQSTNWVLSDTSTCWINKGNGTEKLSFGMPDAYKYEANSTDPLTNVMFREVVTRDGQVSYSYNPKCGTPVAGGGGGGGGISDGPKDCGTRIWEQRAFIRIDGSGTFTILTPDGLGNSNDSSDDKQQFHNCPKAMQSPFFLSGEKPLKLSISKADLADGAKLAISRSATDSTGISSSGGPAVGSIDVDWTVTLCRLTSNLKFLDAYKAAAKELEKSPTIQQFEDHLDDQHYTVQPVEKKLVEGELGANTTSRSQHVQVISIDWSQISNGFELMGILAHELGHANNFLDQGFSPGEAGPFLKYDEHGFSEYEALSWQEELNANLFSLKVLREVERADPKIAPCLEAYVQSNQNPYVRALVDGDVQQVKDLIKQNYDETSNWDRARRLNPVPEVQQKLRTVDLQQLVNAWK